MHENLPTRERIAPPRHGARIRLHERNPDKAMRLRRVVRHEVTA